MIAAQSSAPISSQITPSSSPFLFFFLFIFSPFAFRPRVFRGGKGEREGNAETRPERGWNMRCGQTDLFKGADQTSGLSNYALRAPVDGVVDKNSEMGRWERRWRRGRGRGRGRERDREAGQRGGTRPRMPVDPLTVYHCIDTSHAAGPLPVHLKNEKRPAGL